MRVVVLDGLCMSPWYDRYLVEALGKRINVWLAAISFHLDPSYFRRNGIRNNPGVCDVVSRLHIRNAAIRRLLKLIEYCLNLLALLIRFYFNPPSVVHVQWTPLITRLPFERWFLKALQARGIKVVYTVHNVLPHDTGTRYKPTFRRMYHQVDALVCHTTQAKQELVAGFDVPAHKVWVIPHGPLFHDAPAPDPQTARAKLGVGDEPMVLYFGLMRPYKGVEFLVSAWKEVQRACPEARLWLVGAGNPAYLESISELVSSTGVASTVQTHFRFVDNDEVPIFHAAADVLVYPYREITQSGALLTGMSFGKAIVATAVGGFKETVVHGQTGLLVEYGAVRQLADAIIYLIRHPQERKRLGNMAYIRLHEEYSWEAVAAKTIDCYRAALGAGANGGCRPLDPGGP